MADHEITPPPLSLSPPVHPGGGESPVTALAEAFTNARTGATVVLAFVCIAGFWRVHRRGDDGAPVNWPVTVGRAFGDRAAARAFLDAKGWHPVPRPGARA